ncbi:MAG: ribosomal protein L7/L12 [Fimbriimonas sp.]
MAQKRFYDEDEAEQILKIAAKRMGNVGSVPRDQLLAAAAELGISAEDVQEAEIEYQKTKNELAERREFDLKMRRSFFNGLASYVLVNSGLLALDFFKDQRISWAYWPLIMWGIGIAFHAYGTFVKNSEDYEEEFDKWRMERMRLEQGYPEASRLLQEMSGRIDVRREKIAAIKELREQTGMQLKDAKDAVDEYLQQQA